MAAARPTEPRHLLRVWRALAAVLGLAGAVVTVSPAAPASPAQPLESVTLKLATWNLEWFLTPATFHALQPDCTRQEGAHRHRPRSIPCDVAASLERSAGDIAGMARYARALDADVVALEEVDGVNAARQLFPRHEFCFTGAAAVQNTGFAIRRGLPFRCGADLLALSLGDTVRRGATLVLYPDSRRELHLLAVHLKSGCSRQPLDAPAIPCERLARQAPGLRNWLRAQAAAGHRYALLGDFNRDLLAETRSAAAGAGTGLWARMASGDDADPLRNTAPLVNTAEHQPFHNCYTGQTHSGYIDYILLAPALAGALVPGSFQRLTYSAPDAWRLKLSDHCPVAIRLRLD